MNNIQINHSFCIRCTLPTTGCICSLAPNLELHIPTHILFHPNEIQRRNSSGRLLNKCLNIPSTLWHRLKNDELEKRFSGYALLYPDDTIQTSPAAATINKAEDFSITKTTPPPSGYLWLDATWQESRKMLRQSPWLNQLPKHKIQTHTQKDRPKSQYALRRNQTNNGFSTIETFAYWLDEQNQLKSAQDLLNFFNQFQSAFLKARNSGLFK